MKTVPDAPAPIVALDLDRTLIYSARGFDQPHLPPLSEVEYFQGSLMSRMTTRSWELLHELMDEATVVPVTTRTRAQYERIKLPAVPRFALCSNGGILLCDGVPDPDWSVWVSDQLAESAPLDAATDVFNRTQPAEWIKVVNRAEEMFVYLVAHDRRDIPEGWVEESAALLEPLGWNVSEQGRKVYAMPNHLSKGASLARLRDVISDSSSGTPRLYASGDSLLDASMLTVADRSIRPAHGELHEQRWEHPRVAVTKSEGPLAGEEIIVWMRDQVRHRVAMADLV